MPHPDEPGAPDGSLEITTGEFQPGRIDDLMVTLRRGGPTSIFVHVRILMTETYEFHIQPAVPVSFGESALSGIPCTAIHDFRLIPSPSIAPDHIEWLRHPIEPRALEDAGPYDGMFSVRTVDIDEESEDMASVVEWLNGHAKDREPTAELVLDDLVVPFFNRFVLPLPVHLTAGLRRNVVDVTDPEQVFNFTRDPVHIVIREQHKLALNIASFFYRSLPGEQLDDRFLPTKPEFPTADGWDDPGLTFAAALVFGEESPAPSFDSDGPQQAITFGIEENLTIVLGYKRSFDSDLVPTPGTGWQQFVNALLHWEIAGLVIVDIMGFKVGFSPAHYFGEGASFLDSSVLTGDLFVSMPPTGGDRSMFKLRGLNGEKVAFPIEGIGWRLGGFHMEGVALPDGVVITIWKFSLIISELGIRAEDGASYLSFSGGLGFEQPAGIAAAITVKGLRFRVAGNPEAPSTKLDGFFIVVRGPSFAGEGGGYYRELTVGNVEVTELGFSVSLTLTLAPGKRYVFGVDGIVGDAKGPTGEFDYFMFQAFYVGAIGPLAAFELTGARALYARNMLPALREVDREARELRYLKWYQDTNPLTVPGDRRLAAWRPEKGSWTLGVGASASLPGLGKVVELTVFALLVRGGSEKGLLIVAEVRALGNNRPFGYAAIEFDQRNDRVSFMVGVDVRLSTFVKQAPAWMDGVGALTGTLFVSNDPSTFAIGRLADQSTWLGVRFGVDLWLQSAVVIAFCFERVEGGPNGFALAVRVEGGIGKKGVVRLSYNVGWSLLVVVFSTGSTDYAIVIGIEAGIRFTLFGFLKIGVSASMEFRVVGGRPARGELTAQIKLETPWFLPDVTWRFDVQFGQLRPDQLSTAVQPVRSAGALQPATRAQLPTHIERFDESWNGEGVAPVHSVSELRAPVRPEGQRLANFAANTAVRPIATDSTISVTWAVPINDKLGFGGGVVNGRGDQASGDLSLIYDLVGIAVRRRSRFGPDLAWKPLEQKIELDPDFSDPNGPVLGGTFAPQVLNKVWDVDVRIEGQPAAKKLLLNAVAPYEFTATNAEADEEIVHHQPGWPCCHEPDDKDLSELFHRITWRSADAGEWLAAPAAGYFSDSSSTLRFLRPAWTHPAGFDGLPLATIVASVAMGQPGPVARADFDEDAALCSIRLAWPRAARVTLVMFDDEGEEVGRRELGTATTPNFQTFLFGAKGPIRRLEVRAALPAGAAPGTIVDAPGGVAPRDRRGRLHRPARLPRHPRRRRGVRRGHARRAGRLRGQGQARAAAQPRVRDRADDARDGRAPVGARRGRRRQGVRLRPDEGAAGAQRRRAGRRGDRGVRALGVRGRPRRARLPRGAGDARVRGGLPRGGAAGRAPTGLGRGADAAAAHAAARDARPRRAVGERDHDDGRGLGRDAPRVGAAAGPRRRDRLAPGAERCQHPIQRDGLGGPVQGASRRHDAAGSGDLRPRRSAPGHRDGARGAAGRWRPGSVGDAAGRAVAGGRALHRARAGAGRAVRRPAAVRRRRRDRAHAGAAEHGRQLGELERRGR